MTLQEVASLITTAKFIYLFNCSSFNDAFSSTQTMSRRMKEYMNDELEIRKTMEKSA
jgi:hypothetical protein